MSNGVTKAYTGGPPPPKHSRVPWLLVGAAAVLIALALGWSLRTWEEVPATPAPSVIVTREVSREVTRVVTQPAPTPQTVYINRDQTVIVPQVVYVRETVVRYLYYTPYAEPSPVVGKG